MYARSCVLKKIDKAASPAGLPPATPWVLADRDRLLQIVTNLLTNAAEFTPARGLVDVRVHVDGDRVSVTVRDDGIGMTQELISRIFQPFEQAQNAAGHMQGGLGIGLALVKQLVTMQNGTVEAASGGPGQGSQFTVTLPRTAAPFAATVQSAAAVTTSPAGSVRKVIVVDDNLDAAETTAALLRLAGHETWVAGSGPEALGLVRDLVPDVMIVDLGMPGVSGFDVARSVRSDPRLAGVVRIALTGWGQDSHRRETAASGFHHHLVKPADPEVLQALVETAVVPQTAGSHR